MAEHDEGGASVHINNGRDPRFTKLALGFWNIVNALVVLALGAVANNLWNVNLTLASKAKSDEYIAAAVADNKARLDRHDAEINTLQRDVAVLNKETFRGVDGYDEASEAKRPRRDGH